MLLRASVSFTVLLCGAAMGQTPSETKPKFEVADIHTSPRTTQPFVRGPFYNGGRYELRFATMLDLIRTAYGIDPEKVVGGPNWLEMDRFDVFAKAPDGSTAESRRRMLQALLADRFSLVVHNDSRAHPCIRAQGGQAVVAEGTGWLRFRMQFHSPECTPAAIGRRSATGTDYFAGYCVYLQEHHDERVRRRHAFHGGCRPVFQ